MYVNTYVKIFTYVVKFLNVDLKVLNVNLHSSICKTT